MPKKILKRLTNNLGYKILALVLALVIWLVVVNIEDPTKTQVYTVSVTIQHPNYLKKQGKTYEIQSGTDEISFTVSAKRSIIDELSASDFEATADLKEVDSKGRVPIRLKVLRYSSRIELQKRTQYLVLDIDNLEKETYDIAVDTTGETADGMQIVGMDVSPKSVTVSGPETLVSQISTAEVQVDVTDLAYDKTIKNKIRFLDKNGSEVDTSDLDINHKRADVAIDVEEGKDVALSVKTSGKLNKKYQYDGADLSVSTVRVTGDDSVLDNLSDIIFSGKEFDLTKRKKTFSVNVNLDDYLPDGAALAEEEPSTVKVTIMISDSRHKIFSIPTGQISVEGLEDGYTLKFASSSVVASVKGNDSDLEKVVAADLGAYVNVTGLGTGKHQVSLRVKNSYSLAGSPKLTVYIRKPEGRKSRGIAD